MWISIPCLMEGLRVSTHSYRDIPDVLQCAQHSLEQPERLHWNTPSNVGVPPPGLPLVSLVLSITPFQPNLKLFPWALVTPQSVPLLPGQAGWVTASPCTPFHANPHKNCCTCSLVLLVSSSSFFDLAGLGHHCPAQVPSVAVTLAVVFCQVCVFSWDSPAEEFSGVLHSWSCWHWSC